MTDRSPIGPEDYAEPQCLLSGEPFGSQPTLKPVPQQRIIQKMDEYMAHRDYAGAERHLLYWLEEARLGHDLRGGGTAFVNVATAMNAFGENGRALELFERAREAYEASPSTKPELLGGLYNNMALTCISLGSFTEADALYDLALEQMARVPGGELEQAITLLNRADAVVAEQGMENCEQTVEELLDAAYALFDSTTAPRDGYYAFVCEKCAPVFSYYGYFLAADDLSSRAEKIYSAVGGDER